MRNISEPDSSLFDTGRAGVLICDLGGRLLWQNAEARSLLEGCDPLEVIQHCLSVAGAEEETPFRSSDRRVIQQLPGCVRRIICSAQPLQDRSGAACGSCLIVHDHEEQREIEGRFIRAQRIESLGMLATGIAHDLNNVLVPILMGMSLLNQEAMSVEDRDILRTFQASAQRGAELVKQILTFTRGMEGERVAMDLGMAMEEAAKLMRQTLPKGIEIMTNCAPQLPKVWGNPTQVNQVLLNLAINARDAMGTEGRLVLSCNMARHKNRPGKSTGESAYVVLSVLDTGPGIPDEIKMKIFEPFFTTKSPEKGTGLGLSTVEAIMRRHEGWIEVESQPGRGTLFQAYFPVPKPSATMLERGSTLNLPAERGEGEFILVVDDEATILEIVKAALTLQGYHVFGARNGAEALALFYQYRSELKLVLTDIEMPVMGGHSLAKSLKHKAPEIGIIAMAGNPNLEWMGNAFDSVLEKPFGAEALLREVRKVLHRSKETAAQPLQTQEC